MEKLDVKIVLNEMGEGQVLVNGEDWSDRVKNVGLNSEAGRPAYLSLTIWPTSMEFETPAHVSVHPVTVNVVGSVKLPESEVNPHDEDQSETR